MQPQPSNLGSRPRVLLAEDNPSTRKIMTHWLETHGYTVVQAEDGSIAWDSAKTDCPPIVVTDWNMPRMSGIELCRSIREKHEPDKVYLLVATSRDEGGDITEALKAGANDFLSKPVREDELLARIQNAEQSLRQLQIRAELADLDPLTGLLNRRAFQTQSEKLIASVIENRTRLACIVLDVDFFKRYNDDFGHAMGDSVLVAIANCIKHETRETDLASRLGGDEFCVLIPGVSEQDAFEIAERIRQRIACYTCQLEGMQNPIRATLGVSSWHDRMSSVDELINTADQVLLAAKVNGRNRTACYSHYIIEKIGHRPKPIGFPQSILNQVTVSSISQMPITSMFEEESIGLARRVLVENHIDCIFVTNDKSELVGTITERELLIASINAVACDAPVKTIMSFNFVVYTEDMPIQKFWDSYLRNPNLKSVVVDYFKRPKGLLRGKRLLSLLNDERAEKN